MAKEEKKTELGTIETKLDEAVKKGVDTIEKSELSVEEQNSVNQKIQYIIQEKRAATERELHKSGGQ